MVKLRFLFELKTKVNAKYYFNILLKKLIIEINRAAKCNKYFFMLDGDSDHTAKFIRKVLKDKKQLQLLELHH